MSESKHTQWEHGQPIKPDGDWILFTKGGGPFGCIFADPSRDGLTEGERETAGEKARLAAAAPALLAACEMVLDADGDLYAIDFDQIRGAIQRACGINVGAWIDQDS